MGRHQPKLSETHSQIRPKSLQNEPRGEHNGTLGLQNGSLATMKNSRLGKPGKWDLPKTTKSSKILLFGGLFGVIFGVFFEGRFFIKKT